MKKLVCIESPWAGIPKGVNPGDYLKLCIRDSVSRGEAPIASHAMLCVTRAMNDADESQRALGLTISRVFVQRCDLVAAYVDYGISLGMKLAIEYAYSISRPVTFRRIISHDPVDV